MLDVRPGELHAVIGPNGAGKTTLIGELTGEVTPDGGRIYFDGIDITDLPVFRRSALGLARSFQITSLFLDFSVLDNVALSVQAHSGHSFHFWRKAREEAALRTPAAEALNLANRPRLLLLDEPMAGLGPEESGRMVKLLRELKREFPILLIEHDMEAVFALADRVTVLVYGRVIASDLPEKIRTNQAVRQAYLGEQEVVDSRHA
jgi:branched-chain amino acid transport system ATP-binding protein